MRNDSHSPLPRRDALKAAGVAGDIIGGQVYSNTSGIWHRSGRKPNWTEMQLQVN